MFPIVNLPEVTLRALLQDIMSRASDAPHDNSFTLSIEGSSCGHVFSRAVEALRSCAYASIDDVACTVHVQAKDLSLDDAVANIALALNNAGCVPRWRDELLDLWTTDGKAIGAIERGVVRPLGALTRAVHLNAWSAAGGLWVARRSLTKPTDPGMWDTLVGGLIGLGEPVQLALERESFEEAGLSADNLASRTPIRTVALMRRRLPEGYQRELVLTSECVLPDSVVPENQDGESMTIECLAPQTVLKMLEHGDFTVEASLVILEDLIFQTTGQRERLM